MGHSKKNRKNRTTIVHQTTESSQTTAVLQRMSALRNNGAVVSDKKETVTDDNKIRADVSAYEAKLTLANVQMKNNFYLRYLVKNMKTADLESKIAIQIPSYCDPELLNTIHSAVKTAANPNRVIFLVCLQDDDEAVLSELIAMPNCKVVHIAKKDAPGLCAARHMCNKMLTDEEYVLHIDSHMRFPKFWDVCLISLWKQCEDDKAIITAYGMNYADKVDEPVDSDVFVKELSNMNGRFINALAFSDETVKLRFLANTGFSEGDTAPRKAAFVSGHFIFAKAELDRLVPSDPDMYFVADEISMAVRYWTHGFNIYQPHIIPIFHLFFRDTILKEKHNVDVPRFEPNQNDKNVVELQRMERLFEVGNDDVDLKTYGLGTARTLKDYCEFAGVDFKNKTVRSFSVRSAFDKEHDARDMMHYNIPGNKHSAEAYRNQTIRVLIPAFDNEYVLSTVRSFVENANNPDRLSFSICLYEKNENSNMLAELLKIPRCHVIYRKPKSYKGIGDTLYLLETTCGNEDYTMLTEAFMYAVKDWDIALVEDAMRCGDNALISNWCGGFEYDKLPTTHRRGMGIRADVIQGNNHVGLHFGDPVYQNIPVRGYFAVTQCMFGRTKIFCECKHDPKMVGWTSETSYILSLWTHGYDVYHSAKSYIYRFYGVNGFAEPSNMINMSEDRLAAYIGFIDKDELDLGEFTPGNKRTVEMFEIATGVSFLNKFIFKNILPKGFV